MKKSQRGFTIIELMIASTVFSTVLLVVTGSIVRFTNNFQKGLVENSTQNVARSIIENISTQLQFSGEPYFAMPNGFCIGSTRYTVTTGKQLEDQISNVLLEEQGTGSGCSGPGATRQEMLSPHMRLSKLEIVPKCDLYTITIRVAYGDDDLLDNPTGPNATCKATNGSQFCATRELSTTVQRRL